MSTGNEVRDGMLREAIEAVQAAGEPVTLEAVAARLPGDFDADRSELDAMLAAMTPPDRAVGANAPTARSDKSVPKSVPTMAELQERIVKLNNDLSQARGDVLTLQSSLRTARERLAMAITSFQTGFAKVTREQLMREHIAGEQQRKARGESLNMRGQSRPGPSVVDSAAFYSRGGSANRGYGPKWRRGAFDASQYGRRLTVPSEG